MVRKSMKWIVLGMILAIAVVPARIDATANDEAHVHAKELCLSQSMVQLKGDMRKLWINHVVWTRNYIVSAVAGAPDQDQVLAQLLRNQQDIGDAIKPYYGDAAGNKLAELLKQHIILAGKVLDAAKTGNQADLVKYNKEWYANGDAIVKLLSSVNPNWSEKELKSMFYEHLKLVTDAVVARLKGDVAADIRAFDEGEAHMIKFADILTEGIIKQFPKRFK
jgi:hypothetical protein